MKTKRRRGARKTNSKNMKYKVSKSIGVFAAVISAAFLLSGSVNAFSGAQSLEDVPSMVPAYALGAKPLFTTDIASTSEGELVLTSKGDKSVSVYSGDLQNKLASWELEAAPNSLTIAGDLIYVTLDNSTLEVFNKSGQKQGESVALWMGARNPIVSDDAIYVLEQFTNTVAKIDPQTMQVVSRATVEREPKGAVLTADGKYLYVTNFLPNQRADLDFVAADVSLVNTSTMKTEKNIKLANGSNALRGITLSEDGRYVFVSHNLGRFTVPTSQLQQGWMNTSAMSVIDTRDASYVGAVIIDEPDRGAAGVWDIEEVDGKIFISHSGTHDISIIDYKKFIDKLENYPNDIETLAYDLQFLYGMRQRLALVGNGPREMEVVNGKLVIPTYFSDTVNIVDVSSEEAFVEAIVPMVAQREESLVQKGEKVFNDAQYCFQQWQSCNGCHPGDGRTDGMNWDLMNDGIGNSKNCKSLLYSIQTPPSMITGIRASGQIANRKGFTHIQFYDAPEELAQAVDAYVASLEALPSPYLVNGELSEKAQEGKKVYARLACDECHSGVYYTDMKMYRIGEDIEFDAGWDTPTLREVWRTAPYLFDGRAKTMYDVFAVHRHGIEGKISKKDLESLTEYVLSL